MTITIDTVAYFSLLFLSVLSFGSAMLSCYFLFKSNLAKNDLYIAAQKETNILKQIVEIQNSIGNTPEGEIRSAFFVRSKIEADLDILPDSYKIDFEVFGNEYRIVKLYRDDEELSQEEAEDVLKRYSLSHKLLKNEKDNQ